MLEKKKNQVQIIVFSKTSLCLHKKNHYFQIEPNETVAHISESMMLKMFICTDSSDEQSAFDGL